MSISAVTSLRASATASLMQSFAQQVRAMGAGATGVAPGAASPAPSGEAARQRGAALKAAAALIDSGDTRAGQAEAQRLLDQNPSDPSALRLVAYGQLLNDNYDEAGRLYGRARLLDPSGSAANSEQDLTEALDQGDREVLAAARRKLADPAQRADGIRLLQHLARRSPGQAEVSLAMADGFAAEGKPMQTVAALQEALRDADRSQIGQVIRRASALVDKHPDLGLAHNVLGRALLKAGRHDEAIAELTTASDMAPYNVGYIKDRTKGYVARAVEKLAAGNAISAQQDMQTARGLDPGARRFDEVDARLAAFEAKRYIAGGHYNSALRKLNIAATKAPNDASFKKQLAAQFALAAVHFENHNAEATALGSYIKAYELDPTDTHARRRLAELSYKRGSAALDRRNYDKAITDLDRPRQTYRANSSYTTKLGEAYNLRGQYWVARGQLDKAIADFTKGIAVDPTNASMSSNLSAAVDQQNAT